MTNQVLSSTKYVIENSQHVSIDMGKVVEFALWFKEMADGGGVQNWFDDSPYDVNGLGEKDRLNFTLMFNCFSFCYWAAEGNAKWAVEYNGKEYDGAWGLIACIGKALDKGIPILDFGYLSKMEKAEFADFLKGNTEIPLFEERFRILKETAKTMTEKFKGDFSNLIKEADYDALKLMNLITKNFPSFDDHSEYKGKTVYFHKRAQLLISDIHQAFNNIENISELTACADYKLPQVLRKLGILSYETPLAEKIDKREEIPKDSEEEIEIRANTIWAVELIKKAINSPKITTIHINDYIWLKSQTKSKDDKPYHLTRTTAY